MPGQTASALAASKAKLTFCGVLVDSSIKLNEGESRQLVQTISGLNLGISGQEVPAGITRLSS